MSLRAYLGNSLPGTKILLTPSFLITHILIHPPEDPSRDMARASATTATKSRGSARARPTTFRKRVETEERGGREDWRLTVPNEVDSLVFTPVLLVGGITVTVNVGRSGPYPSQATSARPSAPHSPSSTPISSVHSTKPNSPPIAQGCLKIPPPKGTL